MFRFDIRFIIFFFCACVRPPVCVNTACVSTHIYYAFYAYLSLSHIDFEGRSRSLRKQDARIKTQQFPPDLLTQYKLVFDNVSLYLDPYLFQL